MDRAVIIGRLLAAKGAMSHGRYDVFLRAAMVPPEVLDPG